MNQSKAMSVLTEIANMKRGCAPSAGYMAELILKARDALERKSNKCGNCGNLSCCNVKPEDVACDEFVITKTGELKFKESKNETQRVF